MGVPLQNRFSIEYPGSFLQVDDQGRLITVAAGGGGDSGPTSAERVWATDSVTIANGESLSDSFDMSAYAGGFLEMPASVEGYIHFKVSVDDSTFVYAYDPSGTLLTLTPIAAGGAVALPDYLFGAKHVKLQTDSTAGGTTGQNQTGAAVFTLHLKS